MHRLLSLLAGIILPLVIWGQSVVPAKPSTLVNDFAGILSASERNALESKLVAFNDSTSTQLAVVTEKSLNGEDDFDRAMSIANSWGIGQKNKNNGVLIYIALKDRKIRILTGYGAEGFLTDAMSRRIIEQIIKPSFRSANYYTGLDRATSAIISLHGGEYKSEQPVSVSPLLIIILIFIFIILFLILTIFIRRHSNQGYFRGGRYFRDDNWTSGGGWSSGGWSSGGWSSGGGSSSSGGGFGGFGGFGGGGFGGGGAGGSW
ncbi:MAG: TPM domain-containing protein [Saprospiraceae bacterium]|nr:TPM domain-containing protein [Saprospiraceae bacterium]